MNVVRPCLGVLMLVLAWICLPASLLYSEGPETVPVSEYAPSADLLQQVDFFLGRVEESLAEEADFDLAKQARTLKDANTLAVLGLVLSNHDSEFPERSSMPALVKSAQSLAQAGSNYEQARADLKQMQVARAGQASGDPPLAWQKVASLPALMKQVPLIHAGLKRGTTPSRLKRTAEQSAGQAAALAAIAQASIFDDEYADSPEEAEAWQKFCIEMRDAAGKVNSAVHAGDSEGVDTGMKTMLENCEACHARFR